MELDRHLAAGLRRRQGANLQVISADFLAFDLPAEPYSVIGNVPFARTTEIIRKLSGDARPPRDAWLVVQRELANRMCGLPYGKETLWSLRLKPVWHLEIVARLKKAEFDPPPSVESVFLHMSHRGRAIIHRHEMQAYIDLIEDAFNRNMPLAKTLRSKLSKIQLRRLATDLRFSVDDMPANLTFEQWLGVFRFCLSDRSQP